MAFKIVEIKSWSQYRDLVNSDSYRSWGFRGQSDGDWPLLSSLSRYLQYAKVHRDAWADQEKRILRIFRRKAHLFLQHIPPEKDSFQWLGLMQHHGAPTRMLDLTWSPYVALFFALERGSRTAAVWGFNAGTINESSIHELKDGTRIDVSEPGGVSPANVALPSLRSPARGDRNSSKNMTLLRVEVLDFARSSVVEGPAAPGGARKD